MVARTADSSTIEDIPYLAKENATITMSQNDTYTAANFVSTSNLKSASLIQASDGTALTTAILNNVVTCTSAVTNQKCTLTIVGVKA